MPPKKSAPAETPSADTTSVSYKLLPPEDSVALTLSDAWHYSFNADEGNAGTWVGPFATREDAEKAAAEAIGGAMGEVLKDALIGGGL